MEVELWASAYACSKNEFILPGLIANSAITTNTLWVEEVGLIKAPSADVFAHGLRVFLSEFDHVEVVYQLNIRETDGHVFCHRFNKLDFVS
jgi:hypothetical protein